MRMRIAVPESHVSPSVIDAALEAVTRLDEHMISSGQAPTSYDLAEAGAIWKPEPPGDEHFDHVGTIAARGWGDCDDWAPAHAATLRASGADPGAVARVVSSGPNMFHALVQKSDGSWEDPSVMAGMKPMEQIVVGGDGTMRVQVLDPHDGRVYEGALAPATGPLSMNLGPAISARPFVSGGWEARCDTPLNGSPLVSVRQVTSKTTTRTHQPRRGGARKKTSGVAPYAIACTGYGPDPRAALNAAIYGAVLCGDCAGMAVDEDRWKLLGIQGILAGMPPEQAIDCLAGHIHHDALTMGAVVVGDPLSMAHGIVSSVVGVVNGLPCLRC
jgi:hypothetical protein